MEIVELPPLGRRIEWPTVALAVVIYGLWFLTTFAWREIPWPVLLLAGAWIIAWQMNLQHEIIHGHPTPSRAVNDAIGLWPLSLWLPFSLYRTTHLRHHQDANLTDPFEDPESYYWTTAGWRDLGPFGRAVAQAQSTLLGRIVLGPAWMIGRFLTDLARDVWRGKEGVRAVVAWHLVTCVPVLIWVIGVCGMPVWVYLACFIYPGMSLAMVRSFAEHRAAIEPEKRTAIVENAPHSRPAVPLQQPARRPSPARRAAVVPASDFLQAQPGGADRPQRGPRLSLVCRRRAPLPADAAPWSGSSRLGRPGRMTGGAPIAALPMYDLPEIASANDALWAGIAASLSAQGIEAPEKLVRDVDLPALWLSPNLLFAQTCGYPYVKDLRDSVTLIATPEYAFAGCEGAQHRSFVVRRAADSRRSLETFRGAVAAVNGWDSNTGMNLFRATIAPVAGRRPVLRLGRRDRVAPGEP